MLKTSYKGLFRMNLIPYAYDKTIKAKGRLVKITINPIAAMIRRNSGHPLVGIILRLIPACGGRTSSDIVKSIKLILRSFSAIAKTQGIIGLVKYLKQVSVLTQQSICGYKVPSTTPRVKTTRHGIPTVFPVTVRLGIRRMNSFYIKFSLTLASLYRDLNYKAKPNLSSITSPFSGDERMCKHLIAFIPTFVKLFVGAKPDQRRNWLRGMFVWFPILKSSPDVFGPLSSTNPIVLVRAAGSLTPDQHKNIAILKALSASKFAVSTLVFLKFFRVAIDLSQLLTPLYKSSGFTGKLGFKQEAAGKVRVFAMVDAWTQLVMAPIHKVLFKILKRHSGIDGTFNQLAPIQRIPKGKPLYSMDLSSATDRLPIRIQTPLIQEIFNFTDREALAWEELLIGRPYEVTNRDLPGVNSVKYAVGQPMGALSSWAMLAVTHHLIVQFAAIPVTSGKSLFRDYAVLGDDIVIFNHDVAKRYHNIISSLGVECNLSKSIMSPSGLGLEFAKRTFLNGVNVSPAPLKELASALLSLPGMVEYIGKYRLSIPAGLKVAGFGYKVIGSCNKPWAKLSIKVRYLVLSIMLLSKSTDYLTTFRHLRFIHEEAFLAFFRDFLGSYLGNLINSIKLEAYQAFNLNPGAIPSDLHPEGYGASALPEHSLEDLRGLAAIFTTELIAKFNRNAISAIKRAYALHSQFLQPITINRLIDIMIEIMKIEQQSSRISLNSIFERSDSENQSHRPGVSKLFRFHQAYCQILDSLRRREGTPIPSQVSESRLTSNDLKMKESGFIPIRLLLQSSPILSRLLRITTKRVVLRIIYNRLKWLGGYSVVFTGLSFFFGIAPVVTFFVSVWSAFELLVNVAANSLPMEGSSTVSWISQTVGFIILHVVELWIVTAVFVCGYHWSTFCEYWNMMNQAYQLGDFSFWFCLTDLYFFVNRLIIDTAMEVTPVLTEFGSAVMSTSPIIQVGFGALVAYIGMWFLRWFFGF